MPLVLAATRPAGLDCWICNQRRRPPTAEGTATYSPIRDRGEGEHDHCGYVLPPARNRAHLTSSVKRGVQQADREDTATGVDELGPEQVPEKWRH
jgi:hypothetical protein